MTKPDPDPLSIEEIEGALPDDVSCHLEICKGDQARNRYLVGVYKHAARGPVFWVGSDDPRHALTESLGRMSRAGARPRRRR